MTLNTNCNIRFLDNNLLEASTTVITKSSELAAYPISNLSAGVRSRVWCPSGNFTIDATNNKIYINDGAPKTITLTNASYATPALLATHIATQLNASSANWACVYSSTTYKFTISNTGSVTLRFTQTSGACWTTLGYLDVADATGTSFVGDLVTNHTSEWVIADFGYSATITSFCLICPINEILKISSSATIKLYANSINDFTSPPVNITLTRYDDGIFNFNDYTESSVTYRYWKFEFYDKTNTCGPSGFKISNIYMGNDTQLTSKNIANGFNFEYDDTSDQFESENGTLYFDEKPLMMNLSGLKMQYLTKSEKETIVALWRDLGKTNSFYISLDPTAIVSDNISNLTKFVRFKDAPGFNHVFYDRFTMDFNLKEVI